MAKDRKIDMVILGLLSHEDLTGYDIKKSIDNSISFFWKGSFGSIYPSLNAMEKDGRVTKVTDREKIGGREKIWYSITAEGRKSLEEWLMEEKVTNDLKYETILKIFFGGNVTAEASLATLDNFERGIAADLQILRFYKSNLEKVMDERDHVFFYITVNFGIETYEAYLRWCSDTRKVFERYKDILNVISDGKEKST